MKRLILSFYYAYKGFVHALKTEQNLRIHVSIALFMFIIGFFLKLTKYEWIILVLTIGGMIVVELINTAIERVVDLASPEFHPLAKQAKDIAAAACLVFALMSVIIGVILFLPKIVNIFF